MLLKIKNKNNSIFFNNNDENLYQVLNKSYRDKKNNLCFDYTVYLPVNIALYKNKKIDFIKCYLTNRNKKIIKNNVNRLSLDTKDIKNQNDIITRKNQNLIYKIGKLTKLNKNQNSTIFLKTVNIDKKIKNIDMQEFYSFKKNIRNTNLYFQDNRLVYDENIIFDREKKENVFIPINITIKEKDINFLGAHKNIIIDFKCYRKNNFMIDKYSLMLSHKDLLRNFSVKNIFKSLGVASDQKKLLKIKLNSSNKLIENDITAIIYGKREFNKTRKDNTYKKIKEFKLNALEENKFILNNKILKNLETTDVSIRIILKIDGIVYQNFFKEIILKKSSKINKTKNIFKILCSVRRKKITAMLGSNYPNTFKSNASHCLSILFEDIPSDVSYVEIFKRKRLNGKKPTNFKKVFTINIGGINSSTSFEYFDSFISNLFSYDYFGKFYIKNKIMPTQSTIGCCEYIVPKDLLTISAQEKNSKIIFNIKEKEDMFTNFIENLDRNIYDTIKADIQDFSTLVSSIIKVEITTYDTQTGVKNNLGDFGLDENKNIIIDLDSAVDNQNSLLYKATPKMQNINSFLSSLKNNVKSNNEYKNRFFNEIEKCKNEDSDEISFTGNKFITDLSIERGIDSEKFSDFEKTGDDYYYTSRRILLDTDDDVVKSNLEIKTISKTCHFLQSEYFSKANVNFKKRLIVNLKLNSIPRNANTARFCQYIDNGKKTLVECNLDLVNDDNNCFIQYESVYKNNDLIVCEILDKNNNIIITSLLGVT